MNYFEKIKSASYLWLLALIFGVIFNLAVRSQYLIASSYYGVHKFDLSWGLKVYYGSILFIIICGVSNTLKLLAVSKTMQYVINILLIVLLVFFWLPVSSLYPYRTLCIVFTNLLLFLFNFWSASKVNRL